MLLTNTTIKDIPTPEQGQKLYYDSTMRGFGVRVTHTGKKCFFVEKRIGHRAHRKTIAYIEEISIDKARKEAQKIFGRIALGENPFYADKYSKIHSLEALLEKYIEVKKNLSASTIYQYRRIIKKYLKEWRGLPLEKITSTMVAEKHQFIAEQHSKVTANIAMVLITALCNFKQALYPDKVIKNPANFISSTKGWYKIDVRRNYIKKQQLAAWKDALMKCEPKSRDYLLFILFTGLRRQEAAQLKWEHVDFHSKTFSIIDTKNGDMHELPLTNFLYSFLFNKEREEGNPFVFPGLRKGGHIQDATATIAKIKEEAGIDFTIHDLRRTFATIADSLDVSAYAIKQLLNHRQKADVTAGYIGVDVERLRSAMEKIGAFIIEQFEERL